MKGWSIAFVLIKAELGEEKKLLEALKAIPEVKEAHMVYGIYDIIARVETDIDQELRDVILYKIRRLRSVQSTLTMTVI